MNAHSMTWLSFGAHTEHPGALRADIQPLAAVATDIRALSFPDGHFDGIEAIAVLEHLHRDDALAAVRECWRVLKPGGVLEAGTQDMLKCAQTLLAGDMKIMLNIYSPARPVPERHQWGYTPATFRQLLEAGGFCAVTELAAADPHEVRMLGYKP